jgi:hypothetical protein
MLLVPPRARLARRRLVSKKANFRNGGFITAKIIIMEIISRSYAFSRRKSGLNNTT